MFQLRLSVGGFTFGARVVRFKVMPRPIRPLFDRLIEKIELTESGCWNWTGWKNPSGYGQIKEILPGQKKNLYTHRLSYWFFIGVIPDDMTVDHVCRNTSCCNPNHLRLLTRGENADHHRRKTHCPKGHPYDEKNTVWHPGRAGVPWRACRICKNQNRLNFYYRNKALKHIVSA